HRQIDSINAKREEELLQTQQLIEEQGLPPEAAQEFVDEINARYEPEIQRLNEKYPQEALEAPMLDDALQNATMQRMDAEQTLQQLADEDYNTVKLAGGFMESPDTERVLQHKRNLETRQKEINDSIAAAETRKTTRPETLKDVDSRIDALQNGNKEEFRKADGSLDKAAVRKEFTKLTDEKNLLNQKRVDAKVDKPDAKVTPEEKDVFLDEAKNALGMKKHQNFTQLFQTPRRFLKKLGLNELA